jgi:thiopurine S-methyltransferase
VKTKAESGHDFWAKRWSEGQTGFHEGAPNDLLAKHIARIESVKPRARILVPLSGKAADLRWLAERGHEVVGVEFVDEAVRAFFDEQQLEPVTSEIGGAPALTAGGVTLVCGDFYEVASEALGRFDVVYDRAALVAVDPAQRAHYVETCRARLGAGGVTFLVALAYDQSLVPGPPWSIDPEMVRELHAAHSVAIEVLETRATPTSPRLAAAGVPALMETAYLIRARESLLP